MLDDVELAEHEHRVAEHEAEPDGELVRVELDRLRGHIGKAAMKREFKFLQLHDEAVKTNLLETLKRRSYPFFSFAYSEAIDFSSSMAMPSQRMVNWRREKDRRDAVL